MKEVLGSVKNTKGDCRSTSFSQMMRRFSARTRDTRTIPMEPTESVGEQNGDACDDSARDGEDDDDVEVGTDKDEAEECRRLWTRSSPDGIPKLSFDKKPSKPGTPKLRRCPCASNDLTEHGNH